MLLETLKKLCVLNGVSGAEDEVRDFIKTEAAPFADKMITDNMGNLIVFKKGKKAPTEKLMLAAHMDEVGIIVTDISEDGCLSFDFVGGVDRRVVIGKRVKINGNTGVITCKNAHQAKKCGEENVPKVEDLYIDFGFSDGEKAKKLVSLGDVGAFDSAPLEFGDDFFKAKAIDDRIGCAVLLELLKEELEVDTWFAFTAQEEVGTRGAKVAAFTVNPDVALIVEGTTASDFPGVTGVKRICSPGMGVVIPFMDKGTVYDRELYSIATKLADNNCIQWQTKQMIAGGTDASAIQRSGAGTKVLGLSVAIRNIHSPACVASIKDFELLYKLARLYIKSQGE